MLMWLIVKNSLIKTKILNLPIQSFSQPVSQHFSPSTHSLSAVQKSSLGPSGHSSGSNVGHLPGPANRFNLKLALCRLY